MYLKIKGENVPKRLRASPALEELSLSYIKLITFYLFLHHTVVTTLILIAAAIFTNLVQYLLFRNASTSISNTMVCNKLRIVRHAIH